MPDSPICLAMDADSFGYNRVLETRKIISVSLAYRLKDVSCQNWLCKLHVEVKLRFYEHCKLVLQPEEYTVNIKNQ